MTASESNNGHQSERESNSCLVSKPLISVIICTYNRADFLADALQTVCQQTLSALEYEVIVVDNNSTDETASVCHSFAQRYANVRGCFEPQQGLSHARNRGWREAKGEYVGYIDDDCQVPAEWLSVAKEIIERVSPGVFGGPFFACYKTRKPTWFKDEYGSHIPHEQATRIEGTPGGLYGGNLFVARSLLEQVRGFNPQLGMVGKKMAYGEETALVRAIYAMQPDTLIYYEPRLWLYHTVRAEKMSIRWLMRQRFTNARYMYRVAQKGPPQIGAVGLLLRMVKTLWRLFLSVTVEAMFWKRTKFPYFQNYLYEHAFGHLSRLGLLYEQYHQVTSPKNKEGNNAKSDDDAGAKHESKN